MKMKKVLLGSVIAASLGMAAPAMAFEKGISVSGDAGSDNAWSSTVQVNGHFNSVSISHYAVGGDSVKTVDYKHQLTDLDSPFRVNVGLSGMKSDYSDVELVDPSGDYEAGYALGVHVGFGYDFTSTGTSIDVGVTEEVAESRFSDGQVFEAALTQRLASSLSVKAGFRAIDREIDGESDELLETGFVGLKFHF